MIISKAKLFSLVVLATWLVCEYAGFAQYVVGWGPNYNLLTAYNYSASGLVAIGGQVLTNVSLIAAGNGHALAVRNDGTMVGWGNDNYGQATGPARINSDRILNREAATNIIALSAGSGFSLALRRDGTVLGWGAAHEGRINPLTKREPLSSLTNVVAINSKGAYALALKQDGTVVLCWGVAGVPAGLSNIVAIAASEWDVDALALKRDGTVVEWSNRGGSISQSPGLSNVVAVASGGDNPGQSYALKQDGTVATWNYNSEVATNIPGFENVAAIAAGGGGTYSSYCLALKRDGTLGMWGEWNKSPTFPATVPAGLSNVVAVAAGPLYCLAVTTNWAVAEKFLRK